MTESGRSRRRLAVAFGLALTGALVAIFVQRNFDLPFLSRAPAGTLREASAMRDLLADRAGGEPGGDWIGEIPEDDARELFAMLATRQAVYVPGVLWRRRSDISFPNVFAEHPGGGFTFRTNSNGFREDRELPEDPDYRVLIVGDSHTDGVCENAASFPNRLEERLAERFPGQVVDVVNAGVGGYSFYNYLGVLEAYGEPLGVDLLVVACYAGNDFLETLAPRHYFERSELSTGSAEYARAVTDFLELWGDEGSAALSQGIQQAAFLTHQPEEAELALDSAARLTRELGQRAEALGIDLLFTCIPTAIDTQLPRYSACDPSALGVALGMPEGAGPPSADRWVDPWLAVVEEIGAPIVDVRASWRGVEEELYWHLDHHINLRGHDRLSEALAGPVETLLRSR